MKLIGLERERKRERKGLVGKKDLTKRKGGGHWRIRKIKMIKNDCVHV